MAKILIVEDDLGLADLIEKWLGFEHYVVERATDGLQARDLLQTYKYDAIVLDWQLPKLTGVDLCSELRAAGDTTPIIMLTGKNSMREKVHGLDAGADDYLTKPFDMPELSARIKALLRRASGKADSTLRIADLVLEPEKFRVTKGGKEIALSSIEFSLLEFLMRHPDQVYSCEALLNHVWTSASEVSLDSVRTCVKRLRKKLDGDSEDSLIKNLHGVGYKLQSS